MTITRLFNIIADGPKEEDAETAAFNPMELLASPDPIADPCPADNSIVNGDGQLVFYGLYLIMYSIFCIV